MKMNLGKGPFLGYRGYAYRQGADFIVSIGNGYNYDCWKNNYSVGVPFNYVYNTKGGLGIGDESTVRREFKSPIKGAVVVYKYKKIEDSKNIIIVGRAKNFKANNISHNKLYNLIL